MALSCFRCKAAIDEQDIVAEDLEVWITPKGKRLSLRCPACTKNFFMSFSLLSDLSISEKELAVVNKIKDPDALNEAELVKSISDDIHAKTQKSLTGGSISRIASISTAIANESAERTADALQTGHEITKKWARNAILSDLDLASYIERAITFFEANKDGALEAALENEKDARKKAELRAEYYEQLAGIYAKIAAPNAAKIAALDNYLLASILDSRELNIDAIKKIVEE